MSVIKRLTPAASQLLDAEVTAPEGIVAALADAGVEVVFGMPGGYTGGIYKALHGHPSIKVVQVREESIGSAACDAYGRLRGKPAVIMGQGEWILGNAGQGILEALLGSAPVLVLTEMTDGGALSHHGFYQAGTGDYGAWDAKQALSGICKRVFLTYDSAQAVQHTQLAIKHAVTGEPGPVAVVFSGKALGGKVGPDSHPRLYKSAGYMKRRSRAIDQEALEEAVEALGAAERPVIIAGNGVRVGQACGSLARLAHVLDVPVAMTASGKGVLPETDPLSAGVMGKFGNPAANALIAAADLVLAVGTKLAPTDTADENPDLIDPEKQVLIQIDVEPLNAGWTLPIDHIVLGEAGYVMECIADAFEGKSRPGNGGAERVAEAIDAYGEPETEEHFSDAVPMHPQRIVSVLRELWPSNGIVCTDAGENRLFMMHWYKTPFPGGYLQPAAGGGMGYAIPAAIGAKVACPDQPVLATVGDGGFAMTLGGLMTAVQEKIPICVVVFNNNALGWVLHGMGEKAIAAQFAEFDHAAIARAIGCEGVRVTSVDDLKRGLEEAVHSQVPYVIDVPVDFTTSFLDVAQDLKATMPEGDD